MIEKMNLHYSFTNPASIHDEEALTALELAGRQGAKINEVIEDQNGLRTETDAHMKAQDETIAQNMRDHEQAIDNIRTKTVPSEVKAECARLIESGEFDSSIDEYMGNLNDRVNNLLGSVSEGSTSLDAEVIDIRLGADGKEYTTAGEAVRNPLSVALNGVQVDITHDVVATASSPGENTASYDNGKWEFIYTYGGAVSLSLRAGKWCDLKNKKVAIYVTPDTRTNFYVWFNNKGFDVTGGIRTGPFSAVKGIENSFPIDVPDGEFADNDKMYVYLVVQDGLYDGVKRVLDVKAYTLPREFSYAVNSTNAENAENAKNAELAHDGGYYNPEYMAFYSLGPEGYKPSCTITDNVATIEEVPFSITDTSKTSLYYYYYVRVGLDEFRGKGVRLIVPKFEHFNRVLVGNKGDWSSGVINAPMNDYGDFWGFEVDELDSYYHYFIYGYHVTLKPTNSVFTYEGNRTMVIPVYFAHNGVFGLDPYAHERINRLSEELNQSKYITAWGDSLTAQGGWTTVLQEKSGLILHNAGVGGESPRTIMARQGADIMMVNNITIPATPTPVQISDYISGINTAFGKTAKPLLQGDRLVNPVIIGGVKGTLRFTGTSYNDASGVYTFTRAAEGEEVTINRPTAIITVGDREYNAPYLLIIYMGTNGGFDSPSEAVRLHRMMIEHASAKHFIILGMSSGSRESRSDYESAMKTEFGRYFISLREYLTEYGLADAGLSATADDTAAMAEGRVPPQLLTDGVHYTDTCKTVIGNMLYKKCVELNIFKEGI